MRSILQGWYNKQAKLWCVPLVPIVCNENTDTVFTSKPPTKFLPKRPPPIEAVHNVYELNTQPELIQYLHAAARFPTKLMLIKAIKNKQFASWPGLTTKAVAKHYPESKETLKGHRCKIRSGLRSTKNPPNQVHTIEPEKDDVDMHLAELNKQHHTIYFKIYDAEEEAMQTIYSNQTGRFSKKSSKRNQYIMVLCDIDSNAILVTAMKNCMSDEMICAYQELIDHLHSAGIKPK